MARILGLLLGICATAGCAGDANSNAAAEVNADYLTERGANVHVSADDLRVGGGNHLQLRLGDSTNPLLLVGANAFMPAHGHGSEGSVVASGTAFEARDLVFFMPGRWELRFLFAPSSNVDCTADGESTLCDRLRFYVDVP